MKKLNFIDLFCGAGGLSTGLKQAGLNEVFACDFDKASIETFRANYPKTLAVHDSVQNLTPKYLKELVGEKKIHLVAGGPPCQGFSTIGKGNPEDERNSLFQYFVRTVRVLEPEYVLFENVTGMLSKKNEPVLAKIIRSFKRIGYHLSFKVLEAQQYGVPQKRKRTFIIGSKDSQSFDFPMPLFDIKKNSGYVEPKNLQDILNDLELFYKNNPELKLKDLDFTEILNDLNKKRVACIPPGEKIRYQEDEQRLLPKKLWLDYDWQTIREGRLRENHFHRLDPKKPTPTVNTHNHHYYHPLEVRKFSVREFAMMQSFPMEYEFRGGRTAAIKQIGNAVPPLLAKAIGKAIKKKINENSTGTENLVKNYLKKSIKQIRSEAFIY
jgi:DNA (cytosine-5)-methyltransferase 1